MSNKADYLVSKNLKSLAGGIDDVLKDIAGEPMGFCLFVFNRHEDGHTSYVSNCDREKIIEAIQDWLSRQDESMVPVHLKN